MIMVINNRIVTMSNDDNGTTYTDVVNHSELSAIPVHVRIISGHASLANHGEDMTGKDCMVFDERGWPIAYVMSL